MYKRQDTTNVTGYFVYWGTESGNYASRGDSQYETTCTVVGLEEGRTYYFAVTAYDQNFLESEYSNEVSTSIPVAKLSSSADLTGTWVALAEKFLGTTRTLFCTFQCQNLGVEKVAYSQVAFYLSNDSVSDSTDYFLGEAAIRNLKAGESVDMKLKVELEGSGSYHYLISLVDSAHTLEETDEENNVVVSSYFQ